MRSAAWLGVVAVALACFVAPARARAFTLETPISHGCHEGITLQALTQAGWPTDVARPPAGPEDELLAKNLPFTVPAGADAWTIALLVGVRFNDLHGAAVLDFQDLSGVHFGPENQREHCLRMAEDDGAAGDDGSLATCRAFLLEQLDAALGNGAAPDPSATEQVPVALRFQSGEVALPQFPFRVGRALHTLQDSYSHTLRVFDQDDERVRSVFNWVDPYLSSTYDPARDGWAHSAFLDHCDESQAEDAPRVHAAVRASASLLAALADPTGGRAGRLDRAARVLDQALALEPTPCGDGHAWCPALEQELARVSPESVARGCSAAGSGGSAGTLCVLLAAWALARGALRRAARGIRASLAWVVAAAALAWPAAARAQSAAPSPESGVAPASAHPAAPPRFWLAARLGASLDRGAVFASVGARWDVVPRLQLGVAVEYNPWIDPLSFSATPGTASAYVTSSFRWASGPGFELRSGLDVGASMLTGDLVGSRAGSVGPYVGISLLSVAVALHERVWLEIDPQVVLEVPDVQGVPLLNHQYRLAVGVRFGL